MTPQIRTVKVPVEVRLSRRSRLRLWWTRRRMEPEQREIADAYAKHLDELALYGQRPPHRIVLHDDEEAGDE